MCRGLTDDGYTMSAAFLCDLTPDERFGHEYAMLGTAAGLGVILGPLVGAGPSLSSRCLIVPLIVV